jgi:nitronate monooxygenase
MQEIREWWDGLLILSGCIATGRSVLAAEVLGADLAYVGSPFLASEESNTQPGFRRMIVEGSAADIVTTNCFTGVDANFLRPSLLEHGLDPANLQKREGGGINIDGGGDNAKAWKEIWSAGQGIGAVKRSEPAGDYLDWLASDYAAARAAMGMRQ